MSSTEAYCWSSWIELVVQVVSEQDVGKVETLVRVQSTCVDIRTFFRFLCRLSLKQ